MNVELELPQPGTSTTSPMVVPSSQVERFEITTLKDIKIQNFSSQTNNDAVSDIVYLKEKHVSIASEWFEPLFELVVHPNGHTSDTKGFVSATIRKFWFHPYFVPQMTKDFLKCTVSVLDINGSERYLQSFASEGLLSPGWKLDVFNTGEVGLDKFLRRAAMINKADELLPRDVLTVRFEIFFEFFVKNTDVVVESPKKVNRFSTPVTDNHIKSILSMMEYALDEINHVLHLQDVTKKMFSYPTFRGEMLEPVSDGWEKIFASLYHHLLHERQTEISACYGGWVNKSDVEEPNNTYFEISKISAETERRCTRTKLLAELKRFLLISMNDNYLYENFENQEDNKSLSNIVMTMFSIHTSVLGIFLGGKQNIQVPSHQELVADKLLKDLPILFLSCLVKLVGQLSTRVVIAMSLEKCDLFIPKSALLCEKVIYREEATTQHKKEVESEKGIKNCEVGIQDSKVIVDAVSMPNVVADESIEIKTQEEKHESTIVENAARNEDLKSQIGKMHLEIENKEGKNCSFEEAVHEVFVENSARNEGKDLISRIGKIHQEIENKEKATVKNAARNEKKDLKSRNGEGKNCSFEEAAHDVLMENSARNEEKDLISRIEKIHQEIEKKETVKNAARNEKKDLKSQTRKMHQEIENSGKATVKNAASEKKDLKSRIRKMLQEIENRENAIVENAARNEKKDLKSRNGEGKNSSFKEAAHDVIMENSARNEEKDLISQIGKMHLEIENREQATVKNAARNEKKDLKSRIRKMLQEIENREKEIVENAARNEKERNCCFEKAAHDETLTIQNEIVKNKKGTQVIKLVEKEATKFDRAENMRHEGNSDENPAIDLWQLMSQARDSDGDLLQAKSLMVKGRLLKESSLVFKRMMETCMQEQLKKQIKLDVEFETLELLVDYLKTGELINKDDYDWTLLYKLAHMYNIQSLLPMCSERIAQNITIDNVSQLEKFAEFYQDDHISKQLERFLEGFENMWAKKVVTGRNSKINFESEKVKKESHTEKYVFYQ